MTGYLTRVSLGKSLGGMHVSLRFGIAVKQTTCREIGTTAAYFVPNTVFCLAHSGPGVRQAIHRRIEVLRTVEPGESCSQVLSVLPGAEILLRVVDAAKVMHVVALIQAIEAQHVRPEMVSLDYWRTTHNRLATNVELVPFSAVSHAAFVRRRHLV